MSTKPIKHSVFNRFLNVKVLVHAFNKDRDCENFADLRLQLYCLYWRSGVMMAGVVTHQTNCNNTNTLHYCDDSQQLNMMSTHSNF